LVSVL